MMAVKVYRSWWFIGLVLSAMVHAVPSYISNGQMTWNRGDTGSTWQEWTFDTAQNPASPEQFYNPYGNPSIQFTGSSGSVPFMWKSGVWMGDPVVANITVPNNPVPNPSKTIWFEMVYKAVTKNDPRVIVGDNYQVQQTYYNDRSYSGQWRMMTLGWTIYPNPSAEQFTFALAGTGGFVTSVAIDTLCTVPVPGAVILAGIGAGVVGLIRKRLR